MDVLSDILDILKFNGCLYFTTSFGSPWGVKVPNYGNVARFHFVTQGSCHVRIAGEQDYLYIQEGDFLIIPHGASHELKDKPSSDAADLEADNEGRFDDEGNYVLGDKSSDEISKLVCGHFEFDRGFKHPLIEQLPRYILIKREESQQHPWFHQALLSMTYEAGDNNLGYTEVLKRMSEILFIHTIRMWSEREKQAEQTFVGAVQDPKISRSLLAFHERPNAQWSVDELAKAAGMSRTVFNEKFTKLTGHTPMNYVTLWRVQKAQRLLIERDTSIEWIAHEVGYDSAAAFSRTFKKIAGEGPGAFRRNNRETTH